MVPEFNWTLHLLLGEPFWVGYFRVYQNGIYGPPEETAGGCNQRAANAG
jgi:hypothetical protein